MSEGNLLRNEEWGVYQNKCDLLQAWTTVRAVHDIGCCKVCALLEQCKRFVIVHRQQASESSFTQKITSQSALAVMS